MTGLISNIVFGIVLTALNYLLFSLICTRNMEKVIQQDESKKVERYRKQLEDKQKQLAFYSSRCSALEKKADMLEEEITKLKLRAKK